MRREPIITTQSTLDRTLLYSGGTQRFVHRIKLIVGENWKVNNESCTRAKSTSPDPGGAIVGGKSAPTAG
jgi:hypothetical protein